jgi:eukaryotic-like serine/threonine-protein kinase
MTPDQWQHVTRLFAACLETSPQNREKLLADPDTPEGIRREVGELLQHMEAMNSGFLESSYEKPPEVHPLEAGEVLANRFRIVRLLGNGGMGDVYEAQDQDVGEPIALKVVRPVYKDSPEVSARLRRELQLARRVGHPNVCRVFDLNRHHFPWGDAEFITMELLHGVTLAHLMKQRGPFLPEESLPYLSQILAGLQAAHDVGIVHRDLKPANVMVTSPPQDLPKCVLMDFGLARRDFPLASTMLTGTGEVMGTLAYMAPEQLSGDQISPRTDLYSFGIIMFELLHGYRPSQSIGSGKEQKQTEVSQRNESKTNLAIPKSWRVTMERCLNPDPFRRPKSAAEIAAVLEGKIWLNRRKLLLAGAAAAASAVVAVAGYTYFRETGPLFVPGSTLLVAGPLTSEGDPIGVQVRASLRQSNRLTLWDNTRVDDVWRRMNRSGTPSPSTRDWREIAMRESAEFVLFPSVAQVGDGSSLLLRLEQLKNDPDTPKKAWQKSFEVVDRERTFEAIDAGGRWIRDLIGESAADIDSSTFKPREVTTPSWDALKEYSRGESLASHDRYSALLNFESAARLDPQFTMAWMRLGDIQVSLGRDNDAFAAWQMAADVSRQRPLTRREDLRFRAMLSSDGANFAAAEKLFHEYSVYFPKDWYGTFYRAFPLLQLGRVTESIAEMEKCLSVPRIAASACLQLVVHYLYAGNRKSAETMVKKLRELGSEARAAFSEAMIAHESGDTNSALDALRRAAADATLLPRSKETLSNAIVLADAGRTGDAIDALRRGADEDDLAGERERWAAKLIGLATLMDMEGNRTGAIEVIKPLKRVSVGPTHSGSAGVLFARFGDRSQAERFLATISPDFNYPRFQSPRLRIQAELQFASGNKAEGLMLARKAATVEPPAYGSDYLAASLDRFASREEALSEYKDCLRAKCLQLFLAIPAPAGLWYRASSAIRRLESLA